VITELLEDANYFEKILQESILETITKVKFEENMFLMYETNISEI
jgi:hypothetical protein